MWKKEEIEKLKELSKNGDLFFSEIAKVLNKKPGNVRYMARKLGIKNLNALKNIGSWNIKYKNYKEIIEFYQTHTNKEVCKKFNLRQNQFKSIITRYYKDKKYLNIRKDNRIKRKWTNEEVIKMIQMCGVLPRNEIAENLNRTKIKKNNAVKDKIAQIGFKSKHINGMPITWASLLFKDNDLEIIQTKAGPNSKKNQFNFKIIPWVELNRKVISDNDLINSIIRSMAKFQRFVFQTNDDDKIISILKGYVNE